MNDEAFNCNRINGIPCNGQLRNTVNPIERITMSSSRSSNKVYIDDLQIQCQYTAKLVWCGIRAKNSHMVLDDHGFRRDLLFDGHMVFKC